jgi:hypothetical protein
LEDGVKTIGETMEPSRKKPKKEIERVIIGAGEIIVQVSQSPNGRQQALLETDWVLKSNQI